MITQSIEQLVLESQKGDHHAYRDLMLATQTGVRMYLCAVGCPFGLIDEVLQATYVTCYEKIRQCRSPESFRGWLKTIARTHLHQELKAQKRMCEIKEDRLGSMVCNTLLEEANVADETAISILKSCIEKLSAQSREMIEERYFNNKKPATIARRLNRTEVWTRVTLCRIRQTLRQCIETAGVAHE